jgi:hypothetical protein
LVFTDLTVKLGGNTMPDLTSNMPRPALVAVGPGTSFVEWSAVLAGGAMAAAISFVLLTFGAAIGLSFVSPWADVSTSSKVIASLAVFWSMAQQIGAAIVGGYVAGRMRSRWGDALEDEVEFRDGLHGGLVWAVGIIISAGLLLSAAGFVTRTGVDAIGRVALPATAKLDPVTYQVDVLLRNSAPRSVPATPATSTPIVPSNNGDQRAEVGRVMVKSLASGGMSQVDRDYLAGIVTQRTGLPEADAEKRVNEIYGEASRATKNAADAARRAAILTGFVTAAGLIVALGGAWWSAQRGGHHRDNHVPAQFFTTPNRRPIG